MKCKICGNKSSAGWDSGIDMDKLITGMWYLDPLTNLRHMALYCRRCHHLSDYVGSLNPFARFKKLENISEHPMTNYDEDELSKMELPALVHEAVIDDIRKEK